MKNKIMLATLGVIALSLPAHLHAACSNATVLGRWGFTGNGVIILPTGTVPFAAVGKARFDLEGNVAGAEDTSVGGNTQHETLSGTYSINGDCRMTITANVYDESGTLQRTTVLKGVVTNGGKGSRFLYDSITLPNGAPLPSVATLEGSKI